MAYLTDPNTGVNAAVSGDQQLLTKALIESGLRFVSEATKESYAWASGTYDPDAGDTILAIKNTSNTKKLHITKVWVSCDTESRVVIHIPTSQVTMAGTAITGTNLNTTSANVADADARQDETGNTQGDIVWSGETQAANDSFLVDFEGALILDRNKTVGVDFVAASTAGDVTMFGYFI